MAAKLQTRFFQRTTLQELIFWHMYVGIGKIRRIELPLWESER